MKRQLLEHLARAILQARWTPYETSLLCYPVARLLFDRDHRAEAEKHAERSEDVPRVLDRMWERDRERQNRYVNDAYEAVLKVVGVILGESK